MFVSVNPATGEEIKRFEAHGPAEVERRLADLWSGWRDWRRSAMSDRIALLERLADLLDDRAERYGTLISTEMGKPLAEAVGEIRKCALTARHYGREGAGYIEAESVATEARQSDVAFEPLGPILAIMPWNYPFWQVMRFFIPAVCAGNVALVKHAENVPSCAEAIEELVAEAAGRPDLLLNLRVAVDEVEAVIADDRIRAVTLTGSVRAGRAVAAAAGAHGKKAVLELGGSDPFIVLADADLDTAVRVALESRYGNGGQSCIAAKRFILFNQIASRFLDAFTAGAEALVLGDPLASGTTLGPMARADLRDGLSRQVNTAIDAGARCLTGGAAPDRPGFYYRPTILVDVDHGSAAAQDEMFGPVATVFTFDTPEEAIRLANGTIFGLGASLWTGDIEAAGPLIRDLDAGAVFVNAQVKSDPRVPFGGIKASGYGRELGAMGMREFTNAKLRWIA